MLLEMRIETAYGVDLEKGSVLQESKKSTFHFGVALPTVVKLAVLDYWESR